MGRGDAQHVLDRRGVPNPRVHAGRDRLRLAGSRREKHRLLRSPRARRDPGGLPPVRRGRRVLRPGISVYVDGRSSAVDPDDGPADPGRRRDRQGCRQYHGHHRPQEGGGGPEETRPAAGNHHEGAPAPGQEQPVRRLRPAGIRIGKFDRCAVATGLQRHPGPDSFDLIDLRTAVRFGRFRTRGPGLLH